MSYRTNLSGLSVDVLLKFDFMSFIHQVFMELHPQKQFHISQYLRLIAAKLEECAEGRCRRLIVSLPPRSLKSISVSVAFPAWLLGHNPHLRIISASYAQDLADKHSMDTRTIMRSSWYKAIFATRLSPEKWSVDEFKTTEGGSRMATSITGRLTGRGGDILIIDDPLKPQDIYSETKRDKVNEWYNNTLASRLDDRNKGVIIIVMQRLHQDDLVGHLLSKEKWDVLKLPAIADEDEHFTANAWRGVITFERKAGEVLDPQRESLENLNKIRRERGEYVFQAQFQQNPQPVGGAIIKTHWLCRYGPAELPAHFPYKLQSWDTASKSGELNDYSVCTTWGVCKGKYYLLDVFRKRLEFPDLMRAVVEQQKKHRPNQILIEDKSSGTQLLQQLRRENIHLKPCSVAPGNDKPMRLVAQSAHFENGTVFLPTSAPWLDEYLREITQFPNTKFDDQVDSTSQALEYLVKRSQHSGSIRELRM